MKLTDEQKVLTRKLLFEFLAPEARDVCLAGGFNNWDSNAKTFDKLRSSSYISVDNLFVIP